VVVALKTNLILNRNTNRPVACTADAKLCPDGSYVSRVAPNCNFAPCPVVNGNSNTTGTFNTGGNVNAGTNANTNLNTNTAVNTNATSNVNAVAGPTAGWKTYTNTSLGYSVQYPTTWDIHTCSDVLTVWFGTVKVPCQSEGGAGDFVVQPLDASFNLATTLASDKADMATSVQSTVTVSGVTATRLTGEGKADVNGYFPNGYYKDEVFLKHGDTYYLLMFMKDGPTKQYVSEFNNFLSTFKFD
jgi:hypothetical protein